MRTTKLINFDNDIKKEYKVKLISGSDEAGRGAMAGPIVVATVILQDEYKNEEIRDSKKLNEKTRERLFEEIINNSICYSIKIYDNNIVDLLNPKATSIKGMIEGIKGLKLKPELSLIDGEKINDDTLKTIQLIKGDDKSQVIAAASILAKVTRDRIMINYEKQYPGYDFAKNKGYCTLDHQEKVKKLGILPIHRKTYAPIKNILKIK